MIQYKDYSNKAGIYRFVNKINNKSYVGQAGDLNKRISKHMYMIRNKKDNNPFYKAVIKYGIDSFDLEILDIVSDKAKEELDRLEIYYIDKYDCYSSGYNQTKGGDGGILGYKFTDDQKKHVSENTKSFISTYYKPVYAYNINSKNTIFAISVSAMSNITKKHRCIWTRCCNKNLVTRDGWIASNTKNGLEDKIKNIDLFYKQKDTKFKIVYYKHFTYKGKEFIGSVPDAAKYFNISKSYLYGIVNGSRKSNILTIKSTY